MSNPAASFDPYRRRAASQAGRNAKRFACDQPHLPEVF
jgi:hypothetical protein